MGESIAKKAGERMPDINNHFNEYRKELGIGPPPWFEEMIEEAKRDRVPIMEEEALQFMIEILHLKRPESVLEIGTAIGYSALRMAAALPETSIVSVEKDEERYRRAAYYRSKSPWQQQTTFVLGDALNLQEEFSDKTAFDAVFIDASKGQYQQYFQLCEQLLAPGGLIISDNVLFRGLVADPEAEVPERLQPMVKKIRAYNRWLVERKDFRTNIFPVGDGVAVSARLSEATVSIT
ncbi:O-methyltransferase [Marinococcus luteus]|uniref:O-methyltransferase n=1 Tax=Marinococcus luteus TaxID=1122204 RepID=UPI002ACCD9F8|nr:O-methyltransferase [Marinococcus luteus]MDZ5782904.1 O-methyltransferase [Marinococcus luteus]